jgi:NAD(P)-dependent dehydrogenase (short-subunit alcohol dehydrogenase family)
MAGVETRPLQDRVVVIVGGTTGLGLSAAAACIRAGGKVVIVGRDLVNASAAESQLGQSARAHVGDAAVPQTAGLAIQVALDHFGRFDALYHVAGGSGRNFGDGPLDQITDEGWAATLRLNLDSLFYSSRAAAVQFLKQGSGGSVLNMTSVLAFSPSPEFFATHAYAAAKAAVIGLTKSCAAYYAPHGIRFNAIAPALVETRMSRRATEDEAIMNFIRKKQALDGGRAGQPADLDAAVVYFLSDQSKFVTGQVLAIDGGWSVSEVGSDETNRR